MKKYFKKSLITFLSATALTVLVLAVYTFWIWELPAISLGTYLAHLRGLLIVSFVVTFVIYFVANFKEWKAKQ